MENVRWCGRRLLDGHAGSAIKMLVAIHYSVLDARNGYIRNVVDSVDIGASAKLELVYKFCYLGDMLSVDGDADAAVEARIRIGWNKFRQLVPLLTNKDVYLIMRGRLYSSCVRSSMLHGSETWPVRKENVVALH